MGNSSAKFRKHLQRGDEFAVMQLYERHSDVRKSLDANASYGDHYAHNTPLHFACQHAMKFMIKAFVTDNGGNPNKRNGDDAAALHLICQVGRRNRNVETKLRAECLSFLLAWQGVILANGDIEKPNVDAIDAKKNTPLHYAALSGLKKCVEVLVSKGANIFVENENKDTACDLAIKAGHSDVGEFLESKMLFSQENNVDLNEDDVYPVIEPYNGLREQDLREAKDLLLVETADMLHIPLFTAEALLKHFEWSREALVEAWVRDPVGCCEKCGVRSTPPSLFASSVSSNSPNVQRSPAGRSVGSLNDGVDHTVAANAELSGGGGEPVQSAADIHQAVGHSFDDDPFDFSASLSLTSQRSEDTSEMCEICAENVSQSDTIGSTECHHRFCRSCWKNYVVIRLQEGEYHGINCPAFGCSKMVPLQLIEMVLSPCMARKFLKFDIKAFVDSNPRIKWCPHPGCTNAVRLPEESWPDHRQPPAYLRAFPKLQPPPPSSRTVLCPNRHPFCWDCLADGHEPTSCEKWHDWHDKIAEVKPEELKGTSANSEIAANCLWLVTNSKPCPKCRSPIQKNDGCNHMKCSKCKHDFCWVCLGPWKKHSTETGGYFRCNRYDDSRKNDEKTEQAIAEAKEQSKKTYELNRFVHYYARYKNHLNSYELEKPLLANISSRTKNLSKFAPDESAEPLDFTFIQDSINELLRSRKVLSSSYAYGYFLKDCGYNKTIFEYLQNELEVSVEALSGLVGRNYLRGSKQRIMHTTQLVAAARHRFLLCIVRGLLPPETPPGARKGRRRNLPAILGLDKDEDDWSKTGYPKVEDFDPMRPWIRDSRGKHHNLLAILDWPDEESDEESSPTSVSSSSSLSKNPDPSEPIPVVALCARSGCQRKRVQNPRTGEWHSYCSITCKYRNTGLADDALRFMIASGSGGGSTSLGASGSSGGHSSAMALRRKYNVDLMIALQMSRLQLLHDLKALSSRERDSSSVDIPTSSCFLSSDADNYDDEDADLQMAIERSVLDSIHSPPNQSEAAAAATAQSMSMPALDSTPLSLIDQSSSLDSARPVPLLAASLVTNQASSALFNSADPRALDAYFRRMVCKPSETTAPGCNVNNVHHKLSVNDSSAPTSGVGDSNDVTVAPPTPDKVHKVLIKSLSAGGDATGNKKDRGTVVEHKPELEHEEGCLAERGIEEAQPLGGLEQCEDLMEPASSNKDN